MTEFITQAVLYHGLL